MTTKISTLLKKLGTQLKTQDGRADLHDAIDQWVGDRFGITGEQAHKLDVDTATIFGAVVPIEIGLKKFGLFPTHMILTLNPVLAAISMVKSIKEFKRDNERVEYFNELRKTFGIDI